MNNTILLPRSWHSCPQFWKNFVNSIPNLNDISAENANVINKKLFSNYSAHREIVYGDDVTQQGNKIFKIFYSEVTFPDEDTKIRFMLEWS